MGGGYSARPRRMMPVVAAAAGTPATTGSTTTVEAPPIPDQSPQTSDSAAAVGTESTDTGPGSFEDLHRKCKGVASVVTVVLYMSRVINISSSLSSLELL